MPLAMMKPPMKRKIIGLANASYAVFAVVTPKITASVGPKSDVTGIGIGSVIHHSAISVMMASSLCASHGRFAIGVMMTRMAQIGPQIMPKVRLFRSNANSAS